MNKGILALAVVVIGAVIYLSRGGEEVAHESSTAPAAVEVERTIGLIDDERIKAADSERVTGWPSAATTRSNDFLRLLKLTKRTSTPWVSRGLRT